MLGFGPHLVFDGFGCPSARLGDLDALYGLLDRNLFKIVVDLSGVNYISSAGWGIFIGEIKRIRNHGRDLKLSGMTGDVHELFQLLEFHSILEAYPTAQEAIAAFKVADTSPDRA